MPAERFPLSDPSLPVDPEAVTRSLGATLAARHAAAAADQPALTLTDLAAHLATAAAERGGTMSSGPLEGRQLTELAGFAVAAVERRPVDSAPVAVTPGFSLDDCLISTRGEIELTGDTIAGDRHLDLAAAAVGVADRFGAAVVAPLIDAYGAEAVDLLTLDACQQLIALAAELGWPEPEPHRG